MFFEKLFSQAQAIADPTGSLYADFGVERGGVREMFGARAWVCGLKAVGQGHFINRKVGDPWTLPTVFAIEPSVDGSEHARITWVHRGEHAGDHPDVHDIPALIERTRV